MNNPTVIHCAVARDIDTDETYEFVGEECRSELPYFLRRCTLVVGHNLISFDLPILRRLCGIVIDPSIVHDTLVTSRTLQFKVEGGHSLEAWGKRFDIEKEGTEITDWSEFTPKMLERCISDTFINATLYWRLQLKARIDYKGKFKEAIKVEHEIAFICQEMHEAGFGFDLEKAKELYEEIQTKVRDIDRELETAFPPKEEIIQLKTKTKTIVTPFNPNSPKQIVERLQPYWKPTEFTEKGNPKVCEENLSTLKADAPEAAQMLVMRQMLESRLRTLTQWFEAYDERTRRIHATFIGLGTWTGRMAHRAPNLGNIAAPKSIKYRGEVLAELAKRYGGRMRELWCTQDEETWLVGCDAEGIQLRIFGHYINDQEFIRAVTEGKKEDGTDPHSFNSRILECSRETAKTFIYAFLLGAGDRKIGEILGVSSRAGKSAKQRFIQAIPGLERLKREDIPRDAQRGYIEGLDGRLLGVESEHKVMAAYLQTGEAVIMKHANVLWRRELEDQGLAFRQVNFIHDEWQTEHRGTRQSAALVGEVQARSIQRTGERLGLRCPMAGQYRLGKNWLDTH